MDTICFGNYGNPRLKHLTCNNCNRREECLISLKKFIAKNIKSKLRGNYAEVTFDLNSTPYKLKQQTLEIIYELYVQCGNAYSNFMAGTYYGQYKIPRTHLTKFLNGLSEILTNLNNLQNIGD